MHTPAEATVVRHYVRKRTFSTADRVLVHLSSEALQPADQTQDGIAAATHSGRSTLTKWLNRLEAPNLVVRDRIRLPGHPLPKYAYRLTEAGWEAALALRQRLRSELVTVRAANLGALSVRLAEVPTLAGARLDLMGTVVRIRRGQLDLTRLSPETRRGPAIWGVGLRRVDRFFGREEELEDLDEWWSSASRVLVLVGLAGIGKSALVAAWVQRRRLDAQVYGFEVRGSSTSAGFLSDLGAFLASLGKPGLAAQLAQGVPLDVGFIARLLNRDLRSGRALLIIDNADQASHDLGRLLNRLFLQGDPALPARLVLLGRRAPHWIARVNPGAKPELRRLRGLNAAASLNLLQSRGLGSETTFTEEIVRKTRGHPLLLHLAASTGTGHAAVLRGYLEEEVWGALRPKDRTILQAASVFRRAEGEHVLEKVAGADHRELESLAERNLLERTIAGGFVMHDLVREFVRERLAAPRRRTIQLRAAAILLKMPDSRDRWEGIYHLLEADEVTKAAALLDSKEAPLVDCVAAEEIESVIRGTSIDEGDAGTYCVFAEILGDSLRIRGHVGPAVFQYAHAQRLAENSGRAERVPRLLRKLAYLERCRNRYPRALGYLVEAQARLHDRNDPAETAEVLREMALVEQALGDLAEAAHHLNEAVDLATDNADQAALSRTLLALGSLETQRRHLDGGLGLDLEGLRIAERSGNLTEIAHAHVVIGAALIELRRPEESLKHFSEGLAASKLLGNLRLMAYATMNRTSALLHLRRFADAGTSLRESVGLFDILEEADGLGLLKTYEGEMELGLGHWSRAREAWREGIGMLRVHGSRAELAQVLWDAAGYFSKHGDIRESQSFLREALDIAQRVGNLELVARIQSDLAASRTAPLSKDRP